MQRMGLRNFRRKQAQSKEEKKREEVQGRHPMQNAIPLIASGSDTIFQGIAAQQKDGEFQELVGFDGYFQGATTPLDPKSQSKRKTRHEDRKEHQINTALLLTFMLLFFLLMISFMKSHHYNTNNQQIQEQQQIQGEEPTTRDEFTMRLMTQFGFL